VEAVFFERLASVAQSLARVTLGRERREEVGGSRAQWARWPGTDAPTVIVEWAKTKSRPEAAFCLLQYNY